MSEGWLYSWALGSVSFGGASLLVPLYIVQLGASPFQLGILAATAALIGAPGAIVFGRLANSVGHRRSLVLVTLVTVAGALAVIPFLTTINVVIVANAGLWLVVAAVAPVLTMLVVDDAPESAWSDRIGQLNTYQGYGWAGGLVLGTVWPLVGVRLFGAEDATRVLFWLLAACACASTVGAFRSLPDPSAADNGPSRRRVRRIARVVSGTRRGIKGSTFAFSPNRLYWTTRGIDPRQIAGRVDAALGTYLAAGSLFFAGSAAFWAPLPLFLSDLSFGSGQIFALYLVSSLAAAILYEGAGRVASQYDVRLVQTGALTARALLFPLVALAAGLGAVALDFAAVAVAIAAIGFTWALIAVVGTVIVTRLAPPAIRGQTLGVYTAVGAVAGGIGGLLGGWTATFGYRVAFAIAGGLVLLGGLLVLSLEVLSGGDRAVDSPAESIDDSSTTLSPEDPSAPDDANRTE